MSKKKLSRFKELSGFDNTFEPEFSDVFSQNYFLKGKWNAEVFKNNNPIILELGCGKGEYTIGLAKHFPGKNFIGIDIKGARMWRGAKTAIEESIKNVRFIRTRIEHISSFFAPEEIDEIWLTFPDPQAKDRRYKKRLSSSRFLSAYQKVLKEKGIVHLKTDSKLLHDYTVQLADYNKIKILECTSDLYNSALNGPVKEIQTFYETQFLQKGMPITYLKLELPTELNIVENPDYENG
ncbi:MAG: tRNA (guanosine(46)-N7)-methyltransferase TrmB [Bacteroidales bacterium]|nr:tRNA (guanosine(46)-N7)-methyltransferase TrmB [Bacteroidales bacterium]